ncbi:hypothetical protein C8Q77DRAFT_1158777 [Trametes polyzona]|nr:hypothetical protein C8Q77DRAFT_1158777 [Trametes polyzona]
MDDRPAQLSEKDIPPPLRPPLITPSLSPPGSRISQRIPDRPAPPKRPRLSATPARSASACLPSSRPQDLRLDSSSRLFAFWDQLADRYNVPLEEDDIVDIRELKLIRDRGVTRSAVKAYDIGSLATSDADDNSSQYADEDDENSAGEDTTPADDESADELDLISEPPVQAVVQEKLEYYKNWYVPPPDEQDPEDAEAFREFEEAERRRRELYGNEEEEEIPTGSADTGVGGTAEEDRDDEDGREDEDEHLERPVAEDEDEEEEEEEAKERLPPSDATPQRRISRPPPQPPEDDSSEDELAAWVIDDTPIPRRSAPPPAFDDIIDLTISRSPSPSLTAKMAPGMHIHTITTNALGRMHLYLHTLYILLRILHSSHDTIRSSEASQFMAWMSYCMAGGAFPPPAYFPPPLPPQPVPRTPSRRGYPARQSRSFDTPSSEAGPSRSSTFSSPMHHPHPYPQWFHPAYSSGTLPPSSPIPSSPADSSPVLRPASVPPGQRSQARGRRVSFKLDANDRPLSATPPRHASSRDSIDEDRGFDEEDTRPRGRGGRSATPATVPRNKGKGKARAVFSSDEAEAEEDGEEDDGSQRSPPPRARTPGPPSRREQSVPRGASSSRGKASAKKK